MAVIEALESAQIIPRPSRARVSVADVGSSAFLLAGLAVLAVFGTAQLRSPGVFFKAVTVIVLATAVMQVTAMLIYVLAVKPRLSQRTLYQVTTYRVVVTTGLRTRRAWSAYLDQTGEPVVKRHRNGTEDLVLRAGANSKISQVRGAAFDWARRRFRCCGHLPTGRRRSWSPQPPGGGCSMAWPRWCRRLPG